MVSFPFLHAPCPRPRNTPLLAEFFTCVLAFRFTQLLPQGILTRLLGTALLHLPVTPTMLPSVLRRVAHPRPQLPGTSTSHNSLELHRPGGPRCHHQLSFTWASSLHRYPSHPSAWSFSSPPRFTYFLRVYSTSCYLPALLHLAVIPTLLPSVLRRRRVAQPRP